MRAIVAVVAAVLTLASWLAGQTTQPAPKDDTIDWLMSKATTAPAVTTPTSKPASPFGVRPRHPEARMGTIILSNKERIHAELSTTREKPIRVWDEQAKEYHDVPFALIKSLEAQILWERDEKEWHFKESGSDVKEYSGKTYPARAAIRRGAGQRAEDHGRDRLAHLRQRRRDDGYLCAEQATKGRHRQDAEGTGVCEAGGV